MLWPPWRRVARPLRLWRLGATLLRLLWRVARPLRRLQLDVARVSRQQSRGLAWLARACA